MVTVCNAEKNKEMLKDVPHEIWEDLALTYRVSIPINERERGTILIQKGLLDRWGIGDEEISQDAWENMKQKHPAQLVSMKYFLAGACVMDFKLEGKYFMYILSNAERNQGAVYMLDKQTMSEVSKQLGGNLIIIPSSIHETIIMKEEKEMNLKALREIVKELPV